MRGVPRARVAISRAASGVERDLQDPAGAPHDLLHVRVGVEVQAVHDAEPAAQRRRQQPRSRRGADQREGLERHLHRSRAGPLPDHEVELVVLERRIEDLFDRRRQAVNLVDEQDVARLQVGQDRGQIAGLFEHRARAVERSGAPSSFAITCASVVLPRPGGPYRST